MKKILLAVGCWVMLSAVLFFPMHSWVTSSPNPVYDYVTITETQQKVYVTNDGDKYHNESCHYLRSSKIAKGRTQAYDEGYTACSYCNGSPSGTIEVSYKKKVEKDLTTRNVWYGIGLAISIGFIPAACLFGWIDNKFLTEEAPSPPKNQKAPVPNDGQPKPLSERDKLYKWYSEFNEYQIEGLINRRVIHDAFGEGYITKIIDQKYIEVWFEDLKDFKKFLYPDALADKELYFYR